MADLVNVTDVPVTVDPQTAQDRGDNFTPTDDPVVIDGRPSGAENPDLDADALRALVEGAEGGAGTAAPAASPAPASAPAAAPAVADEGEEVARQNGGQIPKGRFNEVNTARKNAEARAAELEAEVQRLRSQGNASAPAPAAAPAAAAAPASPAFDIDAQEAAYVEALLDGDTGKAAKIRQAINAHILDTAEQRASTRVRGEITAEQQATLLQEASDAAIQAYPFLNTPEGETALRVVVATRDAYIAGGMKPHLALNKAVGEIAPRFAPAPAPATPSRESTAAPPAVDTRSAEAVRRGAQDSNLQPPSLLTGIGNRATEGRLDVTKMSEEQFRALPEAEKKKLRGD